MHLAVVLHAEKVLMRTGVYPEHTFTLARNCSAALAASIAERLRTVLSASAPCTVMTTYAMTECVPICSNPRDGVQKLDSVGPPAGPEVNILLNDGVTLTAAPDVEGEVCVKGACCTAGYEVRPGDGKTVLHPFIFPSLDHSAALHFGMAPGLCAALYMPRRRVLLSAHVCRVLSGACNPALCPILMFPKY